MTNCDVLILGSGPAGAAAARTLAGRGHSVILADRAAFPREKTCGDALLPDAVHALRGLGLLDELGDVLFSVVQVARLAKVDAHTALEHANQKFIRRYAGMQKLSINHKFADLTLQEQMVLWQRVKEDSV